MERKIFADNALDCLGRLGKGVLSDGDEKRNESIRDTPCAALSEELCGYALKCAKSVCEEEVEKWNALSAEKKSELSDLRNVTAEMEKMLKWCVCFIMDSHFTW